MNVSCLLSCVVSLTFLWLPPPSSITLITTTIFPMSLHTSIKKLRIKMKCKKTFVINRYDIPGCPGMSRVFQRHLEIFGPRTLVVMSGRTSRDVPVVPGLLRTFGHGTLVVKPGRTSRDILSCPRTSWDFWTWDFGSHVCKDIPGCPELSQDFLGRLDMGLW